MSLSSSSAADFQGSAPLVIFARMRAMSDARCQPAGCWNAEDADASSLTVAASVVAMASRSSTAPAMVGVADAATWHDALGKCESMGMTLASVHSLDEMMLVAKLGSGGWIGLHDGDHENNNFGNSYGWASISDEEGTFAWTDGSDVDFEAWRPGEPNDSGSVGGVAVGEDCVHLKGDGLWNDAACGGSRKYVCESCGVPPAPTSFVKGEGSLPMAAAEIACIRTGGHLASIHSDADNEAAAAAGGDGAYICFHDIFTEVGCASDGNSADDYDSGFIWTDGTFVDYTNWNNGEPNDWNGSAAGGANCGQATDGAGGEDCIKMRGDKLWNDVGCGGSSAFVCGTLTAPYNIRPYDLDSCTYSIGDGQKNIAEAEMACLRGGGHLASIHDDATNAVLMALGGGNAWIGFHDMFLEVGCTGDGNSADDHDTGFVWTDGTFVDYTNWNNGEPNDWNGSAAGGANCGQSTDGAGGEDCTKMRGDSKWNDVGCGGASGYICGTV